MTEEKLREFWTIGEILELQNKIYPLLGWKGFSGLSLGASDCEANDLWLYMNIRKGTKIRTLKKKLKKVLSGFEFDIVQQEEPTPHFLSIQLSKGEEATA